MSLGDDDLRRLRETIADAQAAGRQGAWPFAAQVVGRDGVLARVVNAVFATGDPTAHAEVHALREAARRVGRWDGLVGATLYASAEPCAMCAAAIHWAGIGRLVFGVGEPRLRRLYGPRPPFRPLTLSCRQVLASGGADIEVQGPLIEDEAAQPHLAFWRSPAAANAAGDPT